MDKARNPVKKIKDLLKINSLKDILQNFANTNCLDKEFIQFSLFGHSKELVVTIKNDHNLFLALTKGNIDVINLRDGTYYLITVSHRQNKSGFQFTFNARTEPKNFYRDEEEAYIVDKISEAILNQFLKNGGLNSSSSFIEYFSSLRSSKTVYLLNIQGVDEMMPPITIQHKRDPFSKL
jgi:hypothetical protein